MTITPMLKRIAFGFTVVIVALTTVTAPLPSSRFDQRVGFNDKMRILHDGRELCVDWWAWPGHMIQHGDTLVGNGSCDVPKDR